MEKQLIVLVFIFVCGRLFSQNDSTVSYYPPLNIPLILAGNFGELRSNHFHMGVDIKTQGKQGFEIHSIEKGYVSRVKVSTSGYGKVVYVDHPNGVTSVYAHCSKFIGKLDSLVKSEQYKVQNFEIEIFPKPNEIKLDRGEVFALSGNTGGSTAPHLHFEIRDTKTEHAKNPLVYAFNLADNNAPVIKRIKVFGVNEQGYMIPGKSKEQLVVKNNTLGKYMISNDTLVVDASFCSSFGGIGLAFDVIDRLNGAPNQCGLYGSYLIVDGDTLFGQKINEISFDHTRYINSHRDISAMNRDYHKSFKNCSNPIDFYINNNLGVIHLNPGDIKAISFIAYDPNGNTSELNFVLKILSGNPSQDYNPSVESFWYPEDQYGDSTENWVIEADSFTIYEPFEVVKSSQPHICSAGTSLQKRIKIKMKLDSPKLEPEKYYLAVTTSGGRKRSIATTYKDGWLEGKTNYAGTFSIQIDQTPPVIKPITTSYNITKKQIRFSIVEAATSLEDYDLFIDDKWYLLEYENKGHYGFWDVPEDVKGIHNVKIIAKDSCGNVGVWEKKMNFN